MDTVLSQFLRQTSYDRLDTPDQVKGVPQPQLEAEYDEAGSIVKLPAAAETALAVDSLHEVMKQRRTVRQYSQDPLTMAELSFLLWCTQGVQRTVSAYDGAGRKTMRTVPSAGARHAFETYLLANNVSGLQAGLYRFLASEHKLVEIDTSENVSDAFVAGCRGQSMVKNSAATFIWVADVYRMTWRFSQRGYRYLFLDAGHVCQNLYLGAEAVSCGACAIGAFDDEGMNRLLGIDGESRFVIYAGTVGRK